MSEDYSNTLTAISQLSITTFTHFLIQLSELEQLRRNEHRQLHYSWLRFRWWYSCQVGGI